MFRPLRSLLAATTVSILALVAAPSQAADTELRVGYIPVLGSGQVFVADQLNWTAEAGLRLRLTQFDSGPNMIQALASGTIDVYVGGFAPLVVARSRGIDVKIVAALANEELVLVGGPVLSKAVADAGSPANGIVAQAKSLGRKVKIGTQPAGSVPQTMLRYYLERVAKVPESAYELTVMGIDATQQALAVGAVDAAIIREPAVTIVRGRDPSMAIIATGGQIIPDQPGSVMGVTGAALKAKPDAIVSLVRLVDRATKLLQSDPAKTIPGLQATLGRGIVSDEVISLSLKSPASKFATDPSSILKSVAAIQAYQKDIGVVQGIVPQDELFDLTVFAKATAAK